MFFQILTFTITFSARHGPHKERETRDPATRTDTTIRGQNNRCRLLELPAELRNRIYRCVIVQQSGTQVHLQGFAGPCLLRTCKEIRREALAIYIHENTIYVEQTGCDSTALQKFTRAVKSMGLAAERLEIDADMDLSQPDWSGVLLWFRRFHAGEIHGRPNPPYDLAETQTKNMKLYTIACMAAVVDELGDLPWARVETILINMRPALTMLDEGGLGLLRGLEALRELW